MKFPSLTVLADGLIKTVKRFPFELFFALLGTVMGIILIESENRLENLDVIIELLMISNLGLSLSLAISFYIETHKKQRNWIIGARIISLIVLLGISFILEPPLAQGFYFRFPLFAIAFHLLVAFSAFSGIGQLNGFWHFNKHLLVRFIISVFYSVVLFIGVVIAIFSVDHLFELNLPDKLFPDIWFVIAGIFNTTVFLAGIPVNLLDLNKETSYPKEIKIFSQYILVPLTSIYLIILLAYEVKIAWMWTLPESGVAALILGYTVFGILSILLIYPVRKAEGNKWIRLFARYFYLLMIPLIVLLILSVWRRISDYGITEERYFLVALALWLTFITGYFLTMGTENIRIIPVSLFVVALLSVYGPQSAFSVSERSQRGRLHEVLKGEKGKKQNAEIISITAYLVRNHGLESLQSFVKNDVDSIRLHYEKKIKSKPSEDFFNHYVVNEMARDSIVKLIKPDINIIDVGDQNARFENDTKNLTVSSASLIIPFALSSSNRDTLSFKFADINFKVLANDSTLIFRSGKTNVKHSVSAKWQLLYNNKSTYKLNKNGLNFSVPDKLMTDSIVVNGRKVLIRFDEIDGNANFNNKPKKEFNYNGYLIIPTN